MNGFLPQTTSDNAVIGGGESRTIAFRPAEPGTVGVHSVPEHPRAHSESGFLGHLDLRRPGRAQPLASSRARVGGTVLALSYKATAADLAAPGDWTCVVSNDTDVAMRFATDITSPSATQYQSLTASFDIELLNIILAEAVADSGLGWHLESSGSADDKRSFASWSQAVAESLPPSVKGLTIYPFAIADFRVESDAGIGTFTWGVVRILNFDSASGQPVDVSLVTANGAPSLQIDIAFEPQAATAVVIDSDANLDELDAEVDVNTLRIRTSLGFDGTLGVTVDASATLKVSGLVAADVSDLIAGKIQDGVAGGWYGNFQPAQVHDYINAFFASLMRLGPQAAVRSYQSDGKSLTVSYIVPVVPPAVAVTHVVATTAVKQ